MNLSAAILSPNRPLFNLFIKKHIRDRPGYIVSKKHIPVAMESSSYPDQSCISRNEKVYNNHYIPFNLNELKLFFKNFSKNHLTIEFLCVLLKKLL